MKKLSVVLVVVLSLCLAASLAIAGEMMKGTVKSVDAKAGSVVLTVDGKDMTLKADAGVDLSKVKAGDKVEAKVEKDMVKEMKAAKPKAAIGC
jgi:Cu/Ag efflux protein CusF